MKKIKNKVGRPKLADNNMKKESILISIFSIFIVIILSIAGCFELINLQDSELYLKLQGNTSKDNYYKGGCGILNIDPVLEPNSSSVYSENKVKLTYKPTLKTDNVYNTKSSIINNTYVSYKNYAVSGDKYQHDNGKFDFSKDFGSWQKEEKKKINNVWNKNNDDSYTAIININEGNNNPGYYYASIYIGKTKCHPTYIIKNGITITNLERKYHLNQYNILTKKGILKGNISDITSSDNKVFDVKKITSLKATSQHAKNGSEDNSNKTATITFSRTGLSYNGSFKIKLVDRYWATGYMSNPLSSKSDDKLAKSDVYSGSIDKLKKTSNFKYNKKSVVGIELKTKENKNVYAMDSGCVSSISSNGSAKIIQIKSTIHKRIYVHTYGNIKNIKVKKGDRVYKGQVIAKTNKNYLYVSTTFIRKKSIALLSSNFIGKNVSYASVYNKNTALKCQKYEENCISSKNDSTTKTSTKKSTTTSKNNAKIMYVKRDSILRNKYVSNDCSKENTDCREGKYGSNSILKDGVKIAAIKGTPVEIIRKVNKNYYKVRIKADNRKYLKTRTGYIIASSLSNKKVNYDSLKSRKLSISEKTLLLKNSVLIMKGTDKITFKYPEKRSERPKKRVTGYNVVLNGKPAKKKNYYFTCSSFVATVYQATFSFQNGLTKKNSSNENIIYWAANAKQNIAFNNLSDKKDNKYSSNQFYATQEISKNGSRLKTGYMQIGDSIVGTSKKTKSNPKPVPHIMLYIGDGIIFHSTLSDGRSGPSTDYVTKANSKYIKLGNSKRFNNTIKVLRIKNNEDIKNGYKMRAVRRLSVEDGSYKLKVEKKY